MIIPAVKPIPPPSASAEATREGWSQNWRRRRRRRSILAYDSPSRVCFAIRVYECLFKTYETHALKEAVARACALESLR
jgi:hypothetical protein